MAELNVSIKKTGKRSRTSKMPVKVDLTAMVDLAFLLITFFMLTTSLTKPRIMPVVMPADGPPGPVSDKCTMTIDLGKNNKVLWYMGMADKSLTTPKVIGYGKQLQDAINATGKQVLASTGKGLIVLIKPADHSVYANLVDALDMVNNLNVPTYTIAAVLPKDAELMKQNGIY